MKQLKVSARQFDGIIAGGVGHAFTKNHKSYNYVSFDRFTGQHLANDSSGNQYELVSSVRPRTSERYGI